MPAKRARQAFVDYSQIQPLIDSGKLDSYDYVFSKDRNALYIIDEELNIRPMKSRFDVYPDESTALVEVNKSSDTYPGEIVMIDTPEDGIKPYVVNRNDDGTYRVVPANSGHIEGIVNYNSVENVPIQNINATNEIIISDLIDGNYAVIGNYRIDANDPTHRMAARRVMFFVETDADNPSIKYITEIKGGRIKLYNCDGVSFDEDKYLLTSEMTTQIDDYLDANLGDKIDDYIGDHAASDEDVQNLFD